MNGNSGDVCARPAAVCCAQEGPFDKQMRNARVKSLTVRRLIAGSVNESLKG